MRTFEIIDSETQDAKPCAILTCDQGKDLFWADIEPWAGPNDVPLAFSPFVEKGERHIPPKWVRAWVDERIAPPTRQNIGQILRAHGLSEYNACALLASGEGRSSQDGFFLREVTQGYQDAALLGKELARARAKNDLSQQELARRSGVRQEVISRIERGKANPTAKTLKALATAMGAELKISFIV